MVNIIKILLLEDSDLDAELLINLLKEEGINCYIKRASNKFDYFNLFSSFDFDVILSDNSLPDYDGISALKYAKEHKPNIPFIFVSGTIGEDRAVEALRHGAKDYVLKQNMNKIIPALQRVMHEVKIEKEKLIAEKELKTSEEKYRNLVNEVNDGFYITDNNGVLTFANNALAKILGFNKGEEILGHNFLEFILPDYANEFASIYRNSIISKESPEIFESEIIRADGKHAFLEIKPVLIIENREVIGTRGVVRDITERKLVEEEIISQKNKFAQLFDNTPIAIALLDINDNILLINESFSILFGYFIDEVKGKNIIDIIVPDDLKTEAIYYSGMTHEGNQINKESYRKKKDGSLIYIQLIGVPIIVKEKTVGTYGIYVDLTQQKKTEEALIKAKQQADELSRLKSVFLSNMSHELRTPLISVLGFAELLREDIKNPEHLEWIEHIFEGGTRLKNTLNSILEFSKLETESVSIKFENCKLADQIENQLKIFQNSARNKNLYLKSIYTDRDLKAKTNPELFGKAVFHILNNAVKFTKTGGVTVTLNQVRKEEQLFAVVKVADTGIGIPDNKIKHLFGDFRQISEGMNRDYEGVGLGLALTRRIVKLLNGKLKVKSSEGIGSEFSIYLPAIPSDNEITKELDLRKSTHQIDITLFGDKGKCSILIVEDNLSNRLLMKRILKNFENISEAEDGITAISLATQTKYDIVLMDINLGPGIDGIETMHRIRKIPGYFHVPIIAVTAYAMSSDKERFTSEGFDAYLTKPFPNESLIELVNKFVKKK